MTRVLTKKGVWTQTHRETPREDEGEDQGATTEAKIPSMTTHQPGQEGREPVHPAGLKKDPPCGRPDPGHLEQGENTLPPRPVMPCDGTGKQQQTRDREVGPPRPAPGPRLPRRSHPAWPLPSVPQGSPGVPQRVVLQSLRSTKCGEIPMNPARRLTC